MAEWLIGIPTCRRPDELDVALRSLENQVNAPRFSVIVVDNDPDGSARDVVGKYGERLDIRYSKEPRPGVVHVRNVILEKASDFRFLLFLDDDEFATEDWIFQMDKARRSYPNCVITGPVQYLLDPKIQRSPLHEISFGLKEHSIGAKLSTTGAGNTLLPMDAIRKVAPCQRFDQRYSFVGGEDTKFFTQLSQAGIDVRWCPVALVFEPVPIARSTNEATEKRIIRSGYSSAMLRLESQSYLRALIGALLRVLVGLLTLCFGISSDVRLRGRVRYLTGRGALSAVLKKELRYYADDGTH